MLDFTIAFNAEPDEDEKVKIRDLTRTTIVRFVESEMLDPQDGAQMLVDIGYSEFAAAGFINLMLADRDADVQADRVDLTEERVIAGLISLNDAAVELDNYGVGADQKALILRKLEVKIAKKTRLPSRAELDKFLEEDLVSVDEYRQTLITLGYPAEWAEKFVALNTQLEGETFSPISDTGE